MQMYCLQRRLQNTNISVTSLHLGVVQTEIARDYNDVWWFRMMKSIARVKGWWVLTVCVLCLFPAMLWICMGSVIVAFPSHQHLLSCKLWMVLSPCICFALVTQKIAFKILEIVSECRHLDES